MRIAFQLATLGLLIAAGAVGYGLVSADRFVTNQVVTAIRAAAPHWEIDVDDVRLDGAEARIFGVTIRPVGEPDAMISVPELVVSFDEQALASSQTITPQHIELRQPMIRLERYIDGSLNIDRLKPWPKSTGTTVLTDISRATIQVYQAGKAAEIRDLDLHLVPKEQGRYAIDGAGRVSNLGDVAVQGDADIARKIFDVRVAGRLGINDQLVETAAAWHSGVRQRLASIPRPTVKVAAGDEARLQAIAGPPSLGLEAEADFEASLSIRDGMPLSWSVIADVVRGQLDNPLFPIPLRNLTGRVEITENGLVIEELSAANGSSGFTVEGRADVVGPGHTQKTFEIRATDLSLDGPLRKYLTPGLSAVHALVNPKGRVDLVAKIDESGKQVNRWELVSLVVRDGSFNCTQFPYDVRDVRGTARQVGPDVELNFKGRAGQSGVSITGKVLEAGKGAGFNILIASEGGVPIERQLINAFDTEALRSVKSIIESLKVTGVADGMVQVSREPGTPKGVRPDFRVDVSVRDATMRYTGLPYRLEDVRGGVTYDDAEGAVWRFSDLSGTRGIARVTGDGTFVPPSPGRSAQLDMLFQADGITYDRELYNALTHAIPSLAPVFDELNLAGKLAARDVGLRWQPGRIPDVDLPEVNLRDGRVRLTSFPYQWDDVEATIRKEDRVSVSGGAPVQRIVIQKLSATHNDTRLDMLTENNGASVEPSFAETLPNGWQVRLNGIQVKDWLLDQRLGEALPADLRATLSRLNVQRPINATGDLIVSSVPQDPLRVAARGTVDFPGNDLTAGVDLKGLRGKFYVNPVVSSINGVTLTGSVDIQQVRGLDMMFSNVRGPVVYRDGNLALGSPAVVTATPGALISVPIDERLTADFYAGRASLDLLAKISDDGELAYDLAASVAEADLNQWAADYQLAELDLQGRMNGEVRLSGLSEDIRSLRGQNGYLTISQARILRLPAIAQMTSVLNLRAPDDTAFRYADFNFDVTDGYFDFHQINLLGNNLSFLGKGRAYFRDQDYGAIDFGFGSYVPPNSSNPLSRMWAQLGTGWVWVQLGGSIVNPTTVVKGRIPLFDGFGTMMQSIESGQFNPQRPRRNLLR